MPINDINFNDWSITYDELGFGLLDEAYFMGWSGHNIPPDSFPPKQRESKLWPSLLYSYASYCPKNKSKETLENAPEIIKQLFLKFYNKEAKTVTLDVSIIAKPYKNSDLSLGSLFYYSLQDYCYIPKKTKNYPKRYYEFLLSDFWIRNKIFKKGTSEHYGFSTFDAQFEAIFVMIWKNYCQLEHRSSLMGDMEFMGYIYALQQLVIDTIINPMHDMDAKLFKSRFERLEPESEDPDDCKYYGLNPQTWANITDNNKKYIRILDSKDYLNAFFEKYNYSTMKNALELFLIKMLESFGDELISRQLLSKCAFCEDYFRYLKGKKYCSLRAEGKDCGKSARNKRYYKKNTAKILPKARKSTRELREFYKEKGIKK
ncbi:hypothetical protein KKC91_09395 [bacterium]|nr:hypothetical protein [bacterium]